MVKVKTLTAARSQQERKTQCRTLGTLRENTVSPKTRSRYNSAMSMFYFFCQAHRRNVPDDAGALDSLFSEYIEHLWEEGEVCRW